MGEVVCLYTYFLAGLDGLVMDDGSSRSSLATVAGIDFGGLEGVCGWVR